MYWKVPLISMTWICLLKDSCILAFFRMNAKLEYEVGTVQDFPKGAQVAVDCERLADHSNPFLHLWRALARSSSLRNLKIIFQNYQVQDFDQQVILPLQDAFGSHKQ